jgi:secernin
MCDTMAATGPATVTGRTIFAKNSDRERNEAQFLDLQPGRRYGRGAILRATYIAIPQASATYATLLSRPFWIWGAEMGVNEHGVAIGNEAVHPRLPPQRRAALIGMDLLRLGLERGASAAEAVTVITSLLEAHGQGGSCGHLGRRYYDNSFIVADAREAFVLCSGSTAPARFPTRTRSAPGWRRAARACRASRRRRAGGMAPDVSISPPP